MILGLGTDLMEVARLETELARDGFREELFTALEIAYCERQHHPARHYAARFAAKEALVKALAGAGPSGYYWRQIEVQNGPDGAPHILLTGEIERLAETFGVRRIHISLAHTRELAMASVVVES